MHFKLILNRFLLNWRGKFLAQEVPGAGGLWRSSGALSARSSAAQRAMIFSVESMKNHHPQILFGHEAGNKTSLLLQISKERPIKGFIEDRRATLETVLNTPDINSIPCYLANNLLNSRELNLCQGY